MRISFIPRIMTAALALSLGLTACGNSQGSDTGAESENVSSEATMRPVSGNSAKVTVEGTKFVVGGKEIWFCGVNTPFKGLGQLQQYGRSSA